MYITVLFIITDIFAKWKLDHILGHSLNILQKLEIFLLLSYRNQDPI